MVVIAITAWIILSSHRGQNTLEALNHDLPDAITFNAQGVHGEIQNRVLYSHAWHALSRWEEGSTVSVLTLAETRGSLFVPLSDLSSVQRAALRSLFQEHLGDAAIQ